MLYYTILTSTTTAQHQNAIMSSIQSRQQEIIAKRQRLAELKKLRETRQKEYTSNRQSLGDASEVEITLPLHMRAQLTDAVVASPAVAAKTS